MLNVLSQWNCSCSQLNVQVGIRGVKIQETGKAEGRPCSSGGGWGGNRQQKKVEDGEGGREKRGKGGYSDEAREGGK